MVCFAETKNTGDDLARLQSKRRRTGVVEGEEQSAIQKSDNALPLKTIALPAAAQKDRAYYFGEYIRYAHERIVPVDIVNVLYTVSISRMALRNHRPKVSVSTARTAEI
jgi:hypothetical protein